MGLNPHLLGADEPEDTKTKLEEEENLQDFLNPDAEGADAPKAEIKMLPFRFDMALVGAIDRVMRETGSKSRNAIVQHWCWQGIRRHDRESNKRIRHPDD